MDYRSCPVCEETLANAQREIAQARQRAAAHAEQGCAAAIERERKRARKITRIEQAKVLVPVSLALAAIVAAIASMVWIGARPRRPVPCTDSLMLAGGEQRVYTCEHGSDLTVEKLDTWMYVRCTCPKVAEP